MSIVNWDWEVVLRSFMDLKIAEESVSSALQVEESETYDDIMKGMRFLCAEDNELNAEILTELLKIKGAECNCL